jgi:6-phosphogluconolactonase
VSDIELRIVDDGETAAAAAAEELVRVARAGGHIALAGGSTPRRAYALAAELERDWSRAVLWFGDERCVPPEDERSNYRLARESLLDRVERAPVVHRVPTERAPEEAAAAYAEELAGVQLDLAVMGLGPDGHTASLFPNAPTLDLADRLAAAAEPGMEPHVERVTLTIPVFNSAKLVLFLVVGEEKAEAAERAFARLPDPATPASLIRSRDGRTVVVLDRAAAARVA